MISFACLLIFISLSLLVSNVENLNKIQADETEGWFLDEFGRVRLFHGVNAVRKSFPWYPDYLFNRTRLDELEHWGFNVVRLGAMWAGAQPSEDRYNYTYIRQLSRIMKQLANRGIYTILDMHQDVLTSRHRISYDGVPRWLVDKFTDTARPFPYPLDRVKQWEEAYLSEMVSSYFQQFYNNTAGAADAWVSYWGWMAQQFANRDGLFGYNLINEPWVGDFYEDSSLVLPGVAGRRNLAPLYDRINKRVRQHDPDTMILYEPMFYGQLFDHPELGSGLDHVPGGERYRNVSAYSYHTYCWPLEFAEPDSTEEQLRAARRYCEREFLPMKFASARANIKRTGGASILTEFGVCADAERASRSAREMPCAAFMRLADAALQSWVAWDYSDGKWHPRGGAADMSRVTEYMRPYAAAVAGRPLRMHFDESTRRFELQYRSAAEVRAPTEIFVPRLRYPHGFGFDVAPADVAIIREGQYLKLRADGSVRSGTIVNVTVFPYTN